MTTSTGEPEMEHSGHLLEAGWLTVQPREGIVHPNSTLELNIRYFPGIAGKFLEVFNIEIGHLPPVPITVSGYGVFPQVYLNVPRPSIDHLSVMLCYEAIAAMTPDFLVFVEDIKVWCHPDDKSFEHDIPKPERKVLKREGWCIISYKMKFPSPMDIDLAIERMMACKHIQTNPLILSDHTLLQKTSCIPQFYTPPYFVNFGYVLPETLVHYTVLALNYGPTDVFMRLVNNFKKTGILNAGFTIQFSKVKLRVGETFPIHVIFFAPLEQYPERKHDLSYTIYLEVAHGPRIPISVNAVVTRPYVETSVDVLEFEEVLCGQSKMMNFILKNTGLITCEWKASLEEVRRKPKKYKEKIPKQPCMFYLRTNAGLLQPNEEILFDIFLEPQRSLAINWNLIITVEHNTIETFVVNLRGAGVTPELKIENPYLEFNPALPFSNNSTKIFKIQNLCPFPIEFLFSDLDEQIFEEERILRLLCQYYSSNDLYIPPRLPGKELPSAFKSFYEEFLQEAISELMKLEEKEETEMLSQQLLPSPRFEKKQKKKKIKTVTTEPVEQSEQDLKNVPAYIIPEETENVLLQYVHKQLEMRRQGEFVEVKDPIRSAIIESKGPYPPSDSTALKEGIVIIFHGAPYTDYQYAANKMARACNIPVINIDSLIIEALVSNKTDSCGKINAIVDEAFKDVADPDVNLLRTSEPTQEDLIDEVKSKIDMIISGGTSPKSGKSKKSPAKSNKSGSSFKSTSTKKGKRGKQEPDTLLSIPEELLTDALRQEMLDYSTGFLIEHLNSIFLRRPLVALNAILKAVGNTKYIHGIIVYNSFEMQDIYLSMQKEAEVKRQEELRLAKLEYFDEISSEELENLSQEDKLLYKNEYLAKRKERTTERLR